MANNTIISGIYDKTINRNEKNGWTKFAIRTKDECQYRTKYGTVICVGNIPAYNKGMPLKIEGFWEDKGYGNQLNIIKIEEKSDSEAVTIEYLNGIIHGVGESTAIKIVKEFGPDIFSFAQNKDAENLLNKCVPNIDAKKFIFAVRNNIEKREVYEYIIKYGGSYSSAVKISLAYSNLALKTLKANPYKIGLNNGLSVEICDLIAKDEGMFAYDEKRVNALILEALSRISLSGHTYTSLRQLVSYIDNMTKNSAFNIKIPAVIIAICVAKNKHLIIEDDEPIRIYKKKIWKYENEINYSITRLKNSVKSYDFKENYIKDIESKLNITYGKKQREAFNLLKTSGIKILTGGPGTGKTTTIRGLIECFKLMKPNGKIALCAPTGRAAQRMSETTNMPAMTMHRLLDFKPYGANYTYKTLASPVDAELIIADEFSMADTELMAILLGAIKNGSLVLLTGDENQLESVGPGNVLHDLIASNKIEVCKLDEIYRQKDDSKVIINSIKINNGDTKLVTGKDFEIVKVDNVEDVKAQVLKYTKMYYQKDDPYYMQVLTPIKKTPIGVFELNQLLQEELNKEKRKIDYGYLSFKPGDKIMTLTNNYQKGYVNGDIGMVKDINDEGLLISINGSSIVIEKENLDDVSLCYATTIHKSQGSEFPITLIVLPNKYKIMLKRKIIYTAVTRAKEKVIIISLEDALDTAILNYVDYKRNTGLLEKVTNTSKTLIPILSSNPII